MTAPTDVRPPDDDSVGIRLPPATGSTRALARRKRRQQRRRKSYLLAAAVVAVVIGLIAALVMRQSPEAAPKREDAAPVVAPHLPRVLLVHTGSDGRARSLSLMAPAETTSTMLLLAPGTMAEVTSLGLEPLSVSLGLGGAERLRATAENLLGIDVEHVVVLDDAGMAAMVKPFEPLIVNIPARVEAIEPGGQVEIIYEPGAVEIRSDETPRLLSKVGKESEMALVARHQAFWQAYAEAAGEKPEAFAKLGPPVAAELTAALKRMGTSETKVKVIPLDRVGRGEDDSEELYAVDEKALRQMLLASFPDDAARLRSRIRVQILNGTGEVELAPRVADKLVPAGVRIALTGNANRFNFDQTQIVFYDRKDQAMAERVRKALGLGRLVLSRNELDVVDVTVIVGKDFSQS